MIRTAAVRKASPRPGAPIGIGRADPREALDLGAFSRVKSVRRFSTAPALLGALSQGEIAAAVRGTLPAPAVMEAVAATSKGARVQRGVLLEPRPGQGVLIGPVGITEGHGAAARSAFGRAAAGLLRLHELLTEDPLIAVMSFGRAEDAGRGARIARWLRESERVVARLRQAGLDAFNSGVQIEDVLFDADIIIVPDGAAGNLAFRALHLAGGMRSFGGLLVGSHLRFVDTSRSRTSYEDPLRLAALLSRRGLPP